MLSIVPSTLIISKASLISDVFPTLSMAHARYVPSSLISCSIVVLSPTSV